MLIYPAGYMSVGILLPTATGERNRVCRLRGVEIGNLLPVKMRAFKNGIYTGVAQISQNAQYFRRSCLQ
jgi:hypothetical protein